MKIQLNLRKFCFFFFGLILIQSPNYTMESCVVKAESKHSYCFSFGKWIKSHGPSLVLSGAICATMNQFFADDEGNDILAMFSQHAFADTTTHSLKNVMAVPVKDKKTLLKSASILAAKSIGLYIASIGVLNVEVDLFPNLYTGFSDSLILAAFYTTAGHFTSEEDHALKTDAELLNKILTDPKFAAICKVLASKTIEVVVHNPDLVAEQLSDPKIAEQLEKIRANPELMQEYQCRSEAWLALQQELTMPDLVPAPAPAALIDIDEDDDTGAGVAAPTRERDGSGASAGPVQGDSPDSSIPEGAHSFGNAGGAQQIEQLAEMMETFSQDPRFARYIIVSLSREIRRREIAIAARQREAAEAIGPALDSVVTHDVQAEAEAPAQGGWLTRVGKVLRGSKSRNQVGDTEQGSGYEPPVGLMDDHSHTVSPAGSPNLLLVTSDLSGSEFSSRGPRHDGDLG